MYFAKLCSSVAWSGQNRAASLMILAGNSIFVIVGLVICRPAVFQS